MSKSTRRGTRLLGAWIDRKLLEQLDERKEETGEAKGAIVERALKRELALPVPRGLTGRRS